MNDQVASKEEYSPYRKSDEECGHAAKKVLQV